MITDVDELIRRKHRVLDLEKQYTSQQSTYVGVMIAFALLAFVFWWFSLFYSTIVLPIALWLCVAADVVHVISGAKELHGKKAKLDEVKTTYERWERVERAEQDAGIFEPVARLPNEDVAYGDELWTH